MVELAKAGKTTGSLAEEFHVTDTTVRNRARQGEVDEDTRQAGLMTEGAQELARLRLEVKVLRQERDIRSRSTACVTTRSDEG